MNANIFTNRRAILQVGAVAGSFALAGLAVPFGHGVLAQEAATPPAAGAGVGANAGAAITAQADPRAAQYQAFLGAFAGHLGMAPDAVEGALRDTMKDMVDEAVAAGQLSADEAARVKQQIDQAETLPVFGGGGPMEGQGKGGRGRGEAAGEPGGRQRGGWDHEDGEDHEDHEAYEDDSDDSDDRDGGYENESAWAPEAGQGADEAPGTHSS